LTELEPRTPEKSAQRSHRPALRHRRGPLNLAGIAIATGLIATLALPAYASTQSGFTSESKASTAQLKFVKQNAQSLVVTPTVAIATTQRDAYTTTLAVQMKPAASVVASRVSAPSLAVAPRLPAFSLDGIVADGLKYVGVPYVYGGSTPAGFDCSGFVLFLYSHVGIHLAHNARIQGESGTVISRADARPGDLVVFSGGGHDGIYMGNDMILDAPKPGGAVGVRQIWSNSVFFVRLGI
jgi:cell wall-associated NlpC family hydrolase